MPTRAQLSSEIAAANVAYAAGESPLTDAEYDEKVRALRRLEGSPPAQVNSDLTAGFAKVKHASPMLSLENAFSAEEVAAFFGRHAQEKLVAEAKMDGLSLELRYEHGRLIQALTRGDGQRGDDVTANVLQGIEGIPAQLQEPVSLRVRGEIFLRRSVWKRLNEMRAHEGESLFANPRNAAAGSLKLKNSQEVGRRGLSFVAYASTIDASRCTQQLLTSEFIKHGFQTFQSLGCGEFPTFSAADAARIREIIATFGHRRPGLDFDIDGIVFKLNNRELQLELGNKSASPRWAVAYKFPPEKAATVISAVEFTVGRTGQVTPVAVLEPVQLGGVTVTSASLMNADELMRIGSPGLGDTVWVERSAEVIPRVVGVKHRAGAAPVVFPANCPFCLAALEKRGVHWFDPNRNCPEQVYARLRHATSKTVLDWDGLGESSVRLLVAQGCRRLSDLFFLPESEVNRIFKTAGTAKFIAERERVKKLPFWRQLAALGVEDIGRTLSKELAARWPSLDLLSLALVTETSVLVSVLGPVAFNKLVQYLRTEMDEIDRLSRAGWLFADEVKTGAHLQGKVFVITGTLLSGSRDEVAAKIEACGGLVKSSVTKATNYLVVGEAPGAGKTAGAVKHRTPTLTEEELYTLLKQPMTLAATAVLEDI